MTWLSFDNFELDLAFEVGTVLVRCLAIVALRLWYESAVFGSVAPDMSP
jgi:hypothetical protein